MLASVGRVGRIGRPIGEQPGFPVYDFRTSIPSGWTFSRASSATFQNSAGLVEEVGVDVSRHEFISGSPVGLLREVTRENIAIWSEDLDNGSWGKNRSSIGLDQTTAPDGQLSADKVIEDTTASNTHYIRLSRTVLNAQTYAQSIFGKADERIWFILAERVGSSGARAWFNLSSGSVGTVELGVSDAAIQAFSDDWYRTSGLITAPSTTYNIDFGLAISDGGASYTGDGTSGLFMWGAQLEQGDYATSYIPTDGTAETRAVDQLGATLSTIGLPSTFEGVITAKFDVIGDGSGTQRIYSINDGSNLNRIVFDVDPGGVISCTVIAAGVTQGKLTSTVAATPGLALDAKVELSASQLRLSVNGESPLSAAITNVTGLTQIDVGQDWDASSQASLHWAVFSYQEGATL